MAWSTLSKSKAAPKAGPKRKATADKPAEVAAPADTTNLCIRRINNGYVVSQSSWRAGKFSTRETFTATKPKIAIGGSD